MLTVMALAVLTACTEVTPEEQAMLAAKGYYTHLAAGECDEFIKGKAGADSLPPDYREQLTTACRQFVDRQRQQHGGIATVKASNARTDTLTRYTSVFLILCYGDSTAEEIVVPMVEHNGRWLMK
jgi:hypothetical protein